MSVAVQYNTAVLSSGGLFSGTGKPALVDPLIHLVLSRKSSEITDLLSTYTKNQYSQNIPLIKITSSYMKKIEGELSDIDKNPVLLAAFLVTKENNFPVNQNTERCAEATFNALIKNPNEIIRYLKSNDLKLPDEKEREYLSAWASQSSTEQQNSVQTFLNYLKNPTDDNTTNNHVAAISINNQ
jgi:hypothetical protein